MSLMRTDNILTSPLFSKYSRDNRAQTQKTGVLQVVVSDEDGCDQNQRPTNPPSCMPLTNCHQLRTLLIPSQELTCSSKPFSQLDSQSKFSVLIYYSSPFYPFAQKYSTATTKFRVPSNYGVKCSHRTLELGHNKSPEDPYTKTKTCD